MKCAIQGWTLYVSGKASQTQLLRVSQLSFSISLMQGWSVCWGGKVAGTCKTACFLFHVHWEGGI